MCHLNTPLCPKVGLKTLEWEIASAWVLPNDERPRACPRPISCALISIRPIAEEYPGVHPFVLLIATEAVRRRRVAPFSTRVSVPISPLDLADE
jgi:hypothetical protein